MIVLFLPQGVLPAVESALGWLRTRGRAGLVGARIGTGGSLDSLTERLALVERDPAVDPPPLLEIKDLRKAFGGLKAVDGASFVVPEGSITGLIGPNGSGKTTMFNLIDDTIHADAGEIWLGGERIDRLSPWARAHRGLGRTFQITRLFREMTVLENVVAPQRSFSWGQLGRVAVSGPEARAAEEVLEYVGMRAFRDQKARRALVRPAEAGGAGAGADARPAADPARRARGRDQPGADRPDVGDDPRAQLLREDVPDRRAQHAVRAGSVRPGARARPRADHGHGHAGRDPEGPGRGGRLPR